MLSACGIIMSLSNLLLLICCTVAQDESVNASKLRCKSTFMETCFWSKRQSSHAGFLSESVCSGMTTSLLFPAGWWTALMRVVRAQVLLSLSSAWNALNHKRLSLSLLYPLSVHVPQPRNLMLRNPVHLLCVFLFLTCMGLFLSRADSSRYLQRVYHHPWVEQRWTPYLILMIVWTRTAARPISCLL